MSQMQTFRITVECAECLAYPGTWKGERHRSHVFSFVRIGEEPITPEEEARMIQESVIAGLALRGPHGEKS